MFLVLPLIGAALAVAQDTAGVGTIKGRVLKADLSAAGGYKVCAAEAQRCDTTKEDGTFRITDLRSGLFTLVVTLTSSTELKTTQVEARIGVEASVVVTLPKIEGVEQSITVSDAVFLPPEEVKSSGYLVSQREIFKSAGALQDVSRLPNPTATAPHTHQGSSRQTTEQAALVLSSLRLQ